MGASVAPNHCLGLAVLQPAYWKGTTHWGPVTPTEGLMAPFPQKLILPAPSEVFPRFCLDHHSPASPCLTTRVSVTHLSSGPAGQGVRAPYSPGVAAWNMPAGGSQWPPEAPTVTQTGSGRAQV